MPSKKSVNASSCSAKKPGCTTNSVSDAQLLILTTFFRDRAGTLFGSDEDAIAQMIGALTNENAEEVSFNLRLDISGDVLFMLRESLKRC